MKVKILKSQDFTFTLEEGQELELPDSMAQHLLYSGVAEEVSAEPSAPEPEKSENKPTHKPAPKRGK